MRAILTYHSIDDSGSVISVSTAAFRRHLNVLRSAAARIVSVEDLLTLRNDNAVAITFDDGYASVDANAAPLLADHGVAATVFVVTDRVGDTNQWARADGFGVLPMALMGWDDLTRLSGRGWTIGSHTATHQDLTRVDANQLGAEIAGAAETLERRLGLVPRGFAYPYGAVDLVARTEVGTVHRWACTTAFSQLTGAEDFDLPRIEMRYFEHAGLFDQWGTDAFARWVDRRRVLRRARGMLRRLGV